MQVTSTINPTNAQFVNEQKESTSNVRVLHNAFLSELPGAAFAVLTLVYIVASLVQL
jgi:hypothetical protein